MYMYVGVCVGAGRKNVQSKHRNVAEEPCLTLKSSAQMLASRHMLDVKCLQSFLWFVESGIFLQVTVVGLLNI